MTIQNFALVRNLKLQRDPQDGTDIIPGREDQSHIFQYDDDLLGVMICTETKSAHRWVAARATFLSAGMMIRRERRHGRHGNIPVLWL